MSEENYGWEMFLEEQEQFEIGEEWPEEFTNILKQ